MQDNACWLNPVMKGQKLKLKSLQNTASSFIVNTKSMLHKHYTVSNVLHMGIHTIYNITVDYAMIQ